MNVALTIWENRVSPVFDAARCLLIAELQNGQIQSSETITLENNHPLTVIDTLLKKDVSVLICGAISRCPARMIEDRSIELISFVSGNYQDILRTFAEGKPLAPEYTMPGCHSCCRRQRG